MMGSKGHTGREYCSPFGSSCFAVRLAELPSSGVTSIPHSFPSCSAAACKTPHCLTKTSRSLSCKQADALMQGQHHETQ